MTSVTSATPRSTPGRAELRTRWVVALTFVTMIAEVTAGWVFGSMALLADGWHMGAHVAALGINLFAYSYARAHADDPGYAFGTGKVSSLGGFTGGIVLAVIGVLVVVESVERAFFPEEVQYDDAIVIACVGLFVNLLSAFLLGHGHGHGHDHDHGHGHDHHHGHHGHHDHSDHNLRAAYLHVLSDALTSFLAIGALLTGKYLGWRWTDPVTGIVAAAMILWWTLGLLRQSAAVLLDAAPDPAVAAAIRTQFELAGPCRVANLHLWQSSAGRMTAVVVVESDEPRSAEHYKALVSRHGDFDRIVVEIQKAEPA